MPLINPSTDRGLLAARGRLFVFFHYQLSALRTLLVSYYRDTLHSDTTEAVLVHREKEKKKELGEQFPVTYTAGSRLGAPAIRTQSRLLRPTHKSKFIVKQEW